MSEVDNKNNEIIKTIVKDKFFLSKTSLDFFNKEIDKRSLANFYQDFFSTNGDPENLRVYFDLPREEICKLDTGWIIFKNKFTDFCQVYNLNYTNFVENKVEINKNEIKLRKALIAFYSSEKDGYYKETFFGLSKKTHITFTKEIQEKIIRSIDVTLEEVSKKCLPKSNIKMVISCNFADWFLCSTAESWRSCLNLESEFHAAYWSGLPGLIGDKNRCLVYITDGNKKRYQGIEVDKIIARSWGLLNADDYLYIVKPYPLPDMFNSTLVQKITSLKTKDLSIEYGRYFSKYPVDLLYFNDEKNKVSSFIFQDIVGFDERRTGFIRGYGRNSYYVYFNDRLRSGQHVFNYSGGLSYLLKNEKSLEDFYIRKEPCQFCGAEETNKIRYIDATNGRICTAIVCSKCHNNRFSVCSGCGTTYLKKDKQFTYEGNFYCDRCHIKLFQKCHECGSFHKNKNLFKLKIKFNDVISVCNTCFDKYYKENFKRCINCGRFEETEEESEDFLCSTCTVLLNRNQKLFNFNEEGERLFGLRFSMTDNDFGITADEAVIEEDVGDEEMDEL